MSEDRSRVVRKVIVASFLGNFVEWFDYATYSYLAVIISRVFFPQGTSRDALVQTFAIFALSFLLRPIGAVLWGCWGDKYGRRWSLSVSILMMAVASFLIGCLPSFAVAGAFAPIGLLVCRMVQGFSASGEYAGAATFLAEYAPACRRGCYVSIVPASTAAGLLMGSLSAAMIAGCLPQGAVGTWGWRLPFLAAGPLGLLARHVWLELEDSPVYQELSESETGAAVGLGPLKTLLREHQRSLLVSIGVASLNAVGFYLVLTYLPTYLSNELGFSSRASFLSVNISLLFYLLAIFVMGWLSDHVGRKRMLVVASVGFVLFSVPLFIVMGTGQLWKAYLAEGVLCLFLTANDGTMASYLAESFPTEFRYTGFAVSQNLANAVFGGTASAVCTWVIGVTGSRLAPAWYLTAVSLLSLCAMVASHEHTGRDLSEVV
ncbi:MFS transporter [Cutibacterium acnes]|jgi:MFS transporter, MHS family, proline/betaine transporter|uniref:MFS transporter n=1 Tax=Cutibacterium acnes TaxID=1747 RepID=UPI000C1E45B6|nr:MFS transporter [Cutibacterium acnes]PIS96834.1 MFS transporter [Cutibacterium acnes]PIS99227.1 MFS transporter [Cutibacterium acnes]